MSLCNWRAVKTGLRHKLYISKVGLFKQGQETLSRYGSTLSPEPAFNPGLKEHLYSHRPQDGKLES